MGGFSWNVKKKSFFPFLSYIDATYTNDVSLLKLHKPIAFTDFVRPVCLPPPDYKIETGRRCTLIGWGQLFEVGKIFRESSF